MLESFAFLLYGIGMIAVRVYLFDNLKSPIQLLRNAVYKYFRPTKVKSLTEQFGNWAAITGSTDGIGKEYAREFARQGLNVVLISRTESKLKTVAADIEQEFGVQTKIVVADFTKGQEVYDHIEKETVDIPVAILVNNVGMSTPQPGELSTFSADELWQVIHTNVGAVTQLSRLFLRRMQKAQIHGAIVNISSGKEMQPAPFGAIYAASKVFTRSLTESLQQEARPHGITVQLVSPNFVATKINSHLKSGKRSGWSPNPERYARFAVYTLGKVDETTGYICHGIQNALLKILSFRIRAFILPPLYKSLVYGDNVRSLKSIN